MSIYAVSVTFQGKSTEITRLGDSQYPTTETRAPREQRVRLSQWCNPNFENLDIFLLTYIGDRLAWYRRAVGYYRTAVGYYRVIAQKYEKRKMQINTCSKSKTLSKSDQ